MGKYQKAKGAEGEREFARVLVAHGYTASRGGYQRGSQGTPQRDHDDVKHNVPGIHFEVKRTKERLDVPAAFRQARREKPNLTPVIAWRSNRQPWRVIMDAEDFLAILKNQRSGRLVHGDALPLPEGNE